jgi:hypothetical protein
MTATDAIDAPAAGAPRRRRDPLRVFRSPLATFLLLAVPVCIYLACVVPHFGGIDEPAHFYRSYQISTGSFLPQKYGTSGFSGACVPRDVILGQLRDSSVYKAHVVGEALEKPVAVESVTASDVTPCPTDANEGFVTFSTFPSPVPYLPQSAAVFVARELGFGVDGMLLLGRFTVLAVYIALVAVAIARTPRSKWALCAVGLLPLALFQAAPSMSHDAFTTAMALLVTSSALRALDPPAGTSTRALVIEAVLLSAVLGSCKPIYVVVAGLYLLPLLGRRRRNDRWPLVFAPVAGVLVTVVCNAAIGDVWKTDAGYFGVHVDESAQQHALLHRPWDFAADLARTAFHQGWEWTHTFVSVGPSVTAGPALLAVLALLIYGATSLQRDRAEAQPGLDWWQRGLVLLLLLAGVVLVAGAQYVSWTPPGRSRIELVQARFFMPLLVLVPVAIGPLPVRWLGAAKAKLPVAALLTPVLVVFCVLVAFRMY